MSSLNKAHSAGFKVSVALAAIKGDLTTAQISSKFKVHATQINRWKKQVIEGLPGIFEDPKKTKKEDEIQVSELFQEIGKLKVENEWLKKKAELVFR